MTAEEIHLNPWLEARGLEVTETDLGEWIVQLRKEGPSHMVMPAIHLSRFQVADLFTDVTGKDQDAEIERLVKVARKELREKFVDADMGITGANYAIADTGAIGIVTNEGNARLVTTLPKVHVAALVGIDKLLPTIADALTINRILPRNATGQAITSYVTWITGPSECTLTPSEKKEMHIVFLDNGRKKTAFHSPCHLCRGLDVHQAPRDLIEKSGNRYIPMAEEQTCCGFGGNFSTTFPAVSREILTRKLDDVTDTDADLLVTECPGCVLQLKGGATKQGREITVCHLSELLFP